MENHSRQIQAAGLGLAAVSYDSSAVLKAFADRMHIDFPLLSDRDSAIIRSFGILNETVQKDSPAYGIPYPGIYILDGNGRVTSKFFEDDFKDRDTAGLILLEQFGIQPETEHSAIAAKHLTLRAAASDSTGRMGQRLSLVLDAVLPRNVHVYAPGVKGYIAIDWQISPTAAFRVEPIRYPPSQLLRLDAIQETVPVYAGHFQLVRNITFGSDQEVQPLLDAQGNLVVNGSFRYQACDEEKCFVPETVPVRIALRYELIDGSRVKEGVRRGAGL